MTDRDRDADVAVRLFGWARRTTECNNEQLVTVPPDWTDLRLARWLGHDVNELVPYFSTDIAAAWSVVEKMRESGWHMTISQNSHYNKEPWDVRFWRDDGRGTRGISLSVEAPLAICRAALLAVGVAVR